MFGKAAFLAVLCISIVTCQPPATPASLGTCMSQVSTQGKEKWPCVMACLGFAEGWLDQDASINPNKHFDAVKQMFAESDWPALTQVVTNCKDAAKGTAKTDLCGIGNKIMDCFKANNGPRPIFPQ